MTLPLPFAVFDEFGVGADDRVHAHIQDAVAAAVAAERDRMNAHAVTLAETARLVEQERCAKLVETHDPGGTYRLREFLAAAIRKGEA